MSKPKLTCSEAQTKLAQIARLKDEFLRVYSQIDSVPLTEARKLLVRALTLKEELRSGMRELAREVDIFEKLFKLSEQYESQCSMLERTGVLEKFSDGRLGIRSIAIEENGRQVTREYPLPTFEEVRERLSEKEEVLTKKRTQGFTKMLLVPFGMPINNLLDRYKAQLSEHYAQGKLFTQNSHGGLDPVLNLNDDSVTTDSQHRTVDSTDSIIYFSEKSKGATKKELLLNPYPEHAHLTSGWQILFVEDMPVIPQFTKQKTIGGRGQLAAGKKPEAYRNDTAKQTQGNVYDHEQGFTPESWIAYALAHLEETNCLLDGADLQEDCGSYLTGVYFPQNHSTSMVSWYYNPETRKLKNSWHIARLNVKPSKNIGARFAVEA